MSVVFLFWDWAGAPAAPPPPPPPPAPGEPGAGGGKGRGKGHGRGKPDYVQFSQEHWDARESYLRSLYPEPIEPAPPPDDSVARYEAEANRLFEARRQQLEQLNAERAQAIIALRTSPDLKSMRSQGARIAELNTKIADLTGKQAVSRFMRH